MVASQLHYSVLLFHSPSLAVLADGSCHYLALEHEHVFPRVSSDSCQRVSGVVTEEASRIAEAYSHLLGLSIHSDVCLWVAAWTTDLDWSSPTILPHSHDYCDGLGSARNDCDA